MFTKSLIFAATVALSAEAVMVKSKVMASSLAGVNVAALSEAELAELRVQTAAVFAEHMNKHGLHAIAQEENEALQNNYIAVEAQVQTLQAATTSSCQFGHNITSTMSEEQKAALNGAKSPEGEEERRDTMLAQGGYGFKVKMSTEEYQELYNQKWEEAQTKGKTCKKFDKQFNKKDDKYMSKKEKKQYNNKVVKKQKMTESQFNDYWMRIMQDRTVAQASITRCDNDNNNDDNNNDDNNNDDNNNDDNNNDDNNDDNNHSDPTECDANMDSFVWGDKYVTPIKNQGQCGSCYSFSAMLVLESALAIQNDQPVVSYSEQQIVDCQDNYDNCGGCNGGWPVSMHQSTRKYPVTTTNIYPYTGNEASCNLDKAESGNLVAANEVYYINGDADSVKDALCTGPITLTVKANGPFMSYSGGVMTSDDCPYNNDLDHAVGAIGWTVKDGQEVLIVRNSWGTWWGDEGYIYMAMDGGNNGMGPCGIFHYPSSANVATSNSN